MHRLSSRKSYETDGSYLLIHILTSPFLATRNCGYNKIMTIAWTRTNLDTQQPLLPWKHRPAEMLGGNNSGGGTGGEKGGGRGRAATKPMRAGAWSGKRRHGRRRRGEEREILRRRTCGEKL